MNRFVQNMSLSRFSPRRKLTKWAKFTFLKFFQALELWPTLFGQKTENHSAKTVVGSNILSYKSRLFSSSSTFEKKFVWPTSLMQQLIVTFLLANGAKTCLWVKNTFLQKSSFSSSSAFEKKIVWPTSLVEQLIVTFLLANGVKTCRWVKHTFLQKSSFFEFFSIWEENCVADIINRTIKCDFFVGKRCEEVLLGQAYFPTKVVFFRILQCKFWLTSFTLEQSIVNI